MTVEELELLQRHPRFPKRLVPVLLAELKRQRAIEAGERAAAERGAVAQAVPGPRRVDSRGHAPATEDARARPTPGSVGGPPAIRGE